MDPYRNDQSMCEKINSSIKKSHKISIYSRKTNKSPKKQQSPFVQQKKYNESYQQQQIMSNTQPLSKELMLLGLNNNNPQSVQLNSAKNYNQKGNNINQPLQHIQRSLSQYNNSNNNNNYIPQPNGENKINFQKQLSYQQKHLQNDFFNQPSVGNNNKKINTFANPFVNANNISQMIDKQAESQINNLSLLEGSFMTGNRNKNIKQSQHSFTNNNNINMTMNSNINSTQQQQTMDNFMKLLHQQISIVKQNYQQKFNLLIKNNVHTIKQLQSRLYQNHVLLKQKSIEIQNMKDIIKKYNQSNSKKIHSQGQIIYSNNNNNNNNNKDKRSLSIGNPNNNNLNNNDKNKNSINNNEYYEKRIADLQSKLRILQGILSKPQQNQRIQKKVQILQKGLVQYLSSRLNKIQTKLQSFIGNSSSKLSTLYQSMQSISVSLCNFRQQSNKIGFNQNKIKQLNSKMNQIDKELRQFLEKQFKYENYGVYQLSQKIVRIKENIKQFEQYQIENINFVKQLLEQLKNNKHQFQLDKKQQNKQGERKQLINLSSAQQTMSKYTQSIINNTSKNSISELSNTHQYSHLIQKLNPKHYYNNNNNNMNQQFVNMNKRNPNNNILNINNNNNNNATSSQSFIQLNFTLQQGEQSIGGESQRIKRQRGVIVGKQQKGQSNIIVSKYTMRGANQARKVQNNNSNINNATNAFNKIANSQNQHQQPGNNNNNVSPSIISKLSLPNTRPSISIQSILSPPHLSSTQEKIRNLSQLKMESKQRLQGKQATYNKQRLSNKQGLSSISSLSQQHFSPQQTARSQQQTPRSPLQKHHQYNNQHPNNNNSSYLQNNSYLSIGQLQDYQSVQYQHLLQLEGNRNNTSYDWSDDQFFYPQLMQKQYQQQSNVQNYCWDKNIQPNSRQELSPKNNNNININSNKNHIYTIPKSKPNNNNNTNSTKFIAQNEQFSPMKKKLISTQTNFYQSMKYNHHHHNNSQQSSPSYQKLTKTKTYHQQNNQHQHQLLTKKLIYSGTFDYQKFSDSQQEKDKEEINKLNSPFINKKDNRLFNNNLNKQQQFTINQQKLIQKIKLIPKTQLPIKFIYDRKKSQAIAKMPTSTHPLNGKSFTLQRKQLQKLQHLKFIQVKTYI